MTVLGRGLGWRMIFATPSPNPKDLGRGRGRALLAQGLAKKLILIKLDGFLRPVLVQDRHAVFQRILVIDFVRRARLVKDEVILRDVISVEAL